MAKNEGSINAIFLFATVLYCHRWHPDYFIMKLTGCHDDCHDTVMMVNISLRHPISFCEYLRSSVTSLISIKPSNGCHRYKQCTEPCRVFHYGMICGRGLINFSITEEEYDNPTFHDHPNLFWA